MNSVLKTEGYVYLCPECGSLSLELPTLAGGQASCKACPWSGSTNELVVTSFQHDQGTDEMMLRRMLGELRVKLAKDFSLPLGQLLYRWGFIQTEEESTSRNLIVAPDELKRYLTAIFHASAKAIIETREVLEKERVHGRS